MKNILATGAIHTLPAYEVFFDEVRAGSIKVLKPTDVGELNLNELKLKILWPTENLWDKNISGNLIVFDCTQ